jgi:hypothetical protein
VIEGALGLGIDLTIVDTIPTMLEEKGFENITLSSRIWPIGT